jgi:competence protein ComGC
MEIGKTETGTQQRICFMWRKQASGRAFTWVELLVIVCIIILVVAALVPALARQKDIARRIRCCENLKRIGVAFKVWPVDSRYDYPMKMEARPEGSLDYATNGGVFRHFQVLSNYIVTPRLLICPADTRTAAKDFGAALSNSNVSYFVGIDAREDYPQMFLSGDRNLTNDVLPPNRILEVTTNTPVGWNHELHNRTGNVLICDGSVQQLSNSRLRYALQTPGVTNRLAIP